MQITHAPTSLSYIYSPGTGIQTAISGIEKQRANYRLGYSQTANISYQLPRDAGLAVYASLQKAGEIGVYFATPEAAGGAVTLSGNFAEITVSSSFDGRVGDKVLSDAGQVLDIYEREGTLIKLSSSSPILSFATIRLMRYGTLSGTPVYSLRNGVGDICEISVSVNLQDRREDELISPEERALQYQLGSDKPPTIYLPVAVQNLQKSIELGTYVLPGQASKFDFTNTFRTYSRAEKLQVSFSEGSQFANICNDASEIVSAAYIIPALLDYCKGEQKDFIFAAGESATEILEQTDNTILVSKSILSQISNRVTPYLCHIGANNQHIFLRCESVSEEGENIRITHKNRGFTASRLSLVQVVRLSGNISKTYKKNAAANWTFTLQTVPKIPDPALAVSDELTIYRLFFDCLGTSENHLENEGIGPDIQYAWEVENWSDTKQECEGNYHNALTIEDVEDVYNLALMTSTNWLVTIRAKDLYSQTSLAMFSGGNASITITATSTVVKNSAGTTLANLTYSLPPNSYGTLQIALDSGTLYAALDGEILTSAPLGFFAVPATEAALTLSPANMGYFSAAITPGGALLRAEVERNIAEARFPASIPVSDLLFDLDAENAEWSTLVQGQISQIPNTGIFGGMLTGPVPGLLNSYAYNNFPAIISDLDSSLSFYNNDFAEFITDPAKDFRLAFAASIPETFLDVFGIGQGPSELFRVQVLHSAGIVTVAVNARRANSNAWLNMQFPAQVGEICTFEIVRISGAFTLFVNGEPIANGTTGPGLGAKPNVPENIYIQVLRGAYSQIPRLLVSPNTAYDFYSDFVNKYDIPNSRRIVKNSANNRIIMNDESRRVIFVYSGI